LLVPYSHWYDGVQLRDALADSRAQGTPVTRVDASAIDLDVGPGCAAVFVPHNPYRNYAFFKPRNAVV
jgi:alpha-glucosidase